MFFLFTFVKSVFSVPFFFSCVFSSTHCFLVYLLELYFSGRLMICCLLSVSVEWKVNAVRISSSFLPPLFLCLLCSLDNYKKPFYVSLLDQSFLNASRCRQQSEPHIEILPFFFFFPFNKQTRSDPPHRCRVLLQPPPEGGEAAEGQGADGEAPQDHLGGRGRGGGRPTGGGGGGTGQREVGGLV